MTFKVDVIVIFNEHIVVAPSWLCNISPLPPWQIFFKMHFSSATAEKINILGKSCINIELTKMLESIQYINGMSCVTIIRKGETSDDYILKSTQK